jgi:hypothetical protein
LEELLLLLLLLLLLVLPEFEFVGSFLPLLPEQATRRSSAHATTMDKILLVKLTIPFFIYSVVKLNSIVQHSGRSALSKIR